jgi:uncharacterized Zn-finger protein
MKKKTENVNNLAYANNLSDPMLGKKRKENKKEKYFKCNVEDCNKFLENEEELIKHQTTHSKNGLITCSYSGCNKKFLKENSMKKHEKQHFPINKKYLCPFPGCDKRFTASYNQKVRVNFIIIIK